MKKNQLVLLIAVAIVSVLSVLLLVPNSYVQALNDNTPSHKYYYDSSTGMYNVRAGGGADRLVAMKYYPTDLEINVGDTVIWYNPTKVPEPHTVTFIKKPDMYPPLMGVYAVSNSSQLVPLPPGTNNEPLVLPSQNGKGIMVVGVNARVYNPVVIDSTGKEITLPPNANYTMDGTEQYVNSGYLLPKGQTKEMPGSSETFKVKFEKPGSYPYTCMFHPWMVGTIIVK